MKWHKLKDLSIDDLLYNLNRLEKLGIAPENIKIIDGSGNWGYVILYRAFESVL